MKSYTVTITPDDGEGAKTIVKLHVDGGTARIKKLSLKAGSGSGLSATQLPAIDLQQLLASVLPAADVTRSLALRATRAAEPTLQPMTVEDDVVAHAAVTEGGVAAAVAPPRRRAPVGKAAPAKRAGTAKKAAAAKTAPAAKKAAKSAPAAKTAPAAKKAAKKAPSAGARSPKLPAPAGKKERAYRVMPDDFVNSHGKTTMADLAEVYDVPLHTIQAWVNTARKQGRIAPARPRNRS